MFPNQLFAGRLFSHRYFSLGSAGLPGYQQLAVGSGVQTLSIPPWAHGCYLQAETNDVRFRFDGAAPTTSVGMLIKAGQNPFWFSERLGALQFIGAASPATLNVEFK
jgi:hypothetical protein